MFFVLNNTPFRPDWRKVTLDEEIKKSYEEDPSKEDNPSKDKREKKQSLFDLVKKPKETLSPDSSLKSAWEILKKYKFQPLPVLSKEGKLLGLVTENDLFQSMASHTKNTILVKDIMDKKVLCATKDVKIDEVTKVLFDDKVKLLPILDENYRLIGLITRDEIIDKIVKVSSKFIK